jgi:hypothetical protein
LPRAVRSDLDAEIAADVFDPAGDPTWERFLALVRRRFADEARSSSQRGHGDGDLGEEGADATERDA